MIAYASVSEWNKGNFARLDLNANPSLAFDDREGAVDSRRYLFYSSRGAGLAFQFRIHVFGK